MYAVVEINGKQYRAEQGKNLTVDRIAAEAGASLSFETVLLLSGDSGVKVGSPYVAGASVTAVVEEEIKADKVIVFKYKPKKDYRRTQGHRQKYTILKVQEIVGA
ncbi:MAG: 50S ribosomal protein L21 [Spirochaetes bacterium]|nr:50S ribosomal protein L21 [Spirochaetota bacterium]